MVDCLTLDMTDSPFSWCLPCGINICQFRSSKGRSSEKMEGAIEILAMARGTGTDMATETL